jgi:hypothetical protein
VVPDPEVRHRIAALLIMFFGPFAIAAGAKELAVRIAVAAGANFARDSSS